MVLFIYSGVDFMTLEHQTEELIDELYDANTYIAVKYIEELYEWLDLWLFHRSRAAKNGLIVTIKQARRYLYY